MKRCPVCRRTYPDDAQLFCLEDGATLVSAPPSQNPSPYDNRQAPTDPLYPRPTAGADRAYQPTVTPYSQPYPAPQKKSALPWVLGIVGVLVAGVGITILLLSNRSSGTTSSGTTNVNVNVPASTPYPTATPYAISTPSSESWQPINGDEFTASMPDTPITNEQTEPSPAGPIHIHLFTAQQGYEGFIVGYSEYPDIVFASGDNEALFNGARNGAIQNVNGKVTNERSISLGSHPGREITGNAPSQNISFTVRLYIAKPRLYMLMYTQYGLDKPISEDGKRFLDSFQITK